jgi:Mn-dependent DtxR family transcriptional regulator
MAATSPLCEFDFVLRARAARNLLQLLKFVCRCAKGKPVIHPSRREIDTLKLKLWT